MKFEKFFMQPFDGDRKLRLTILLNRMETHEGKQYLLILGQDLETWQIVKLVDTHGLKYDLYKWNSDWAALIPGSIIEVTCAFHSSLLCANVLRVKSKYSVLRKLDYIQEIKKSWSDYVNHNEPALSDFAKIDSVDISFVANQLQGKRCFALYPMCGAKVVEYTTNRKTKFQLRYNGIFADILKNDSSVVERKDRFYNGFTLLEFMYKEGRFCLKVYDFLNEDSSFQDEGTEAVYQFQPSDEECNVENGLELFLRDEVLTRTLSEKPHMTAPSFEKAKREHETWCWGCKKHISSQTAQRCQVCGWYICPICGACGHHCAGVDSDGYDRYGFNQKGWNRRGFNRKGIHKNGTRFDSQGYDKNGYDANGFDEEGYNYKGYDSTGHTKDGYDIMGYDCFGFDRMGFDKFGYDRFGYDRNGFDTDGRDRNGYDRRGFTVDGIHKNGKRFDDKGYAVDGRTFGEHLYDEFPVNTVVELHGVEGFIAHRKLQNGIAYVTICFVDGIEKTYDLCVLAEKEHFKKLQFKKIATV